MKGLLLAGGKASRLLPVSRVINKHLLPVYDEPLIFHPLRTLTQSGVSGVLLVTGPEHIEGFRRLLGGGEEFGCRLHYMSQPEPDGTGAAVLLAEDFVDGDDFAVILGDNLFSENFTRDAHRFCVSLGASQAMVFLRKVRDPRPYGVAAFRDRRIASLIEKPLFPPSHHVVTGLWMLRPGVFLRLRRLSKSPRGEYEITGVLDEYAREGTLAHAYLKGFWMDVGSFESLHRASAWIRRTSHPGMAGDRRVPPPLRPAAGADIEVVCCGGTS